MICLKKCYDMKTPLNFTKNDLTKLADCQKDCGELKKDLKTFFDNIQFLAEVRKEDWSH